MSGQYFTNTSPVTGQPIAEFPRSDAKDIELALDAAHAAADAWGKTSVQERSNVLLAIADRIEARLENAGAGRDLGQRQADARDAERRPAAGGRPFPLLRRLHPRAGGQHRRDRREHRGLSLPRAARRGRPDHPVELPAADGRLEAGAGAGRRQLRGAETGRADARSASAC